MMNKMGAFFVGLCMGYASMAAMDEQQMIPVTDLNDQLSVKLLKAIMEDDSKRVEQLLDLIPGDTSSFINQYPVNTQAKKLWDSKSVFNHMCNPREALYGKAHRALAKKSVNKGSKWIDDKADEWKREKEANPTISYLYNGLLTEVKSVTHDDLAYYERHSKTPLNQCLFLGLMYLSLGFMVNHWLMFDEPSLGSFDDPVYQKKIMYGLLQTMILVGYLVKKGQRTFTWRDIFCDANYKRRDIRVLLENAGMDDGVRDIIPK